MGVKEDSQRKLQHGVTHAQKTVKTLKEKGAQKAKKCENFQKFSSFQLVLT